MSPSEKTTRLTLMYMGLMPFIGFSYAALLPSSSIISPQTALLALSGYSSIILTFLAGCLWQHSSKGIIVLSNIIALFAWLSYLTPSPLWLGLGLCFLILLLLDYSIQTAHKGLLFHRFIITSIVCSCLISVSFWH